MSDSNPPDETPNDDDPFAEFEDWLVDGPAGKWPDWWEDTELSDALKQIVQRNAQLLTDPDRLAWNGKAERFEEAITVLGDEEAIKAKRAAYAIRFDDHRFMDGEKDFRGYHFPCSISFDGVTFGEGYVSFYGATFGDGTVSFDVATFGEGGVSFDGATFGDGNVSFLRATFGEGYVSFEGATFGEGEFWFSGLHVKGQLDCTGLDVQKAVFRNTTVDGFADWTDAKFGSIPDFRQMKLDRTPEVARMSVPAPGMTGYWPLSAAKDQQDVLKLRKLKAMAIAANDHEKDGEFFAYEMMAKRGWETKGVFGLLANWLYWITSNYGRSYEVPFCWMVASFLGFATHYAWWLNRYVPMEDAGDFAFWFSLKNTVPFLGTLFRFVAEPENYTSQFDKVYSAAADAGLNVDALIHTGLFQGVLSLILFFFLLLGLRNRFRLK